MAKRIGITCGSRERAVPYEEAVRLAGLEPVRISARRAPALHEVHGFLISGGPDVNPALYGEARDPRTEAPDDARDALELRLFREAVARDVPVLAICRGLQLANVARGGTLRQHIEGHAVSSQDKSRAAHQVRIEAGSRLASFAGEGCLAVNSRHHQAIGKLGDGLRISARSEDGVIEAVEMPDLRFLLAVQWHPENQAAQCPRNRALFEALAAAVA